MIDLYDLDAIMQSHLEMRYMTDRKLRESIYQIEDELDEIGQKIDTIDLPSIRGYKLTLEKLAYGLAAAALITRDTRPFQLALNLYRRIIARETELAK